MDNTTRYLNTEWAWKYEKPALFHPLWIEEHDEFYWRKFMWEHPSIPYFACAIYLAVIFGLQRYMRNRAPIKAQKFLIAWNLSLAVLSFFGFFRIIQELLLVWAQPNGLYKSLCVRTGRNVPADFWGLIFVFSKYLELGDTVLIVLRKQPLLALQWYHHCLVTVFSWKLFPWKEPILSWYACMNYGIHQFMYLYFALRGMKVKVPEILAMSITTMQILQMVFGVGINVFTMYMIGTGELCTRHPTSIKFSLGVYLSLWILFAKFFLERYYLKSRVKKLE